MQLPDGTELMHAALPYDPAKAHAYYLQTRQLHPRTGGGTYTVNVGAGQTVRLSAQQLVEQKAYAAARVASIKKDLNNLGILLRDKVRKAKEAEVLAAKPPTLVEKAQAVRDAKKYRDSHQQKLATKAKQTASKVQSTTSSSSKAPVDTVDSLKKHIVRSKASLKAAVAKQQELVTATKNG